MRLVSLVTLLGITTTALAGARPHPDMGRVDRDEPPDIGIAFAPRIPPPPQRILTAAPETTAQAKRVAGTWQCKGITMRDDGSSLPIVATLATKLDLQGGWIQSSLTENKLPRFAEYRSFDPIAQQWTSIALDTTSGFTMTTSLGEKAGTWTWIGAMQSQTGSQQVRDFETLSGTSLKRWGEVLLGGAWQKRYEMTCTK